MSQSPRNEPPRHKSLASEFMVPGIIFAAAIVVAILVLLLTNGPSSGPAETGSGDMISAETETMLREEFDVHGVSEGGENAVVVVREFADYQCPACASFEPTARTLREEYADNPNVRFVFFAFPLRSHRNARPAAQAAFCAEQRGKFWSFHERLFAKQQAWSQSAEPQSMFIDMAVETGIPLNAFRQCLEQDSTAERVNKSGMAAAQTGIVSTPTTLVGRRVFAGITPLNALKQEIDNQLAANGNK